MFLRHLMSAQQDDWADWLPIATAVHNHFMNATTKVAPSKPLLGYLPRMDYLTSPPTLNKQVEQRTKMAKERREQAKTALNKLANMTPPDQFTVGDRVWLKAKNLKLPYQTPKLAPKRHGPFTITKCISPVAYQLQLPLTWTVHNVFHAGLLTPYRETIEHGVNFTKPPPEVVNGNEEYKVEAVLNHRHHGRGRKLQYLIKWKGYSSTDNTWEPVEQVFAPDLVRRYHLTHPLDGYKRPTSSRRVAIRTSPCPPLANPPCNHLLNSHARNLLLMPPLRHRSTQGQATPPTSRNDGSNARAISTRRDSSDLRDAPATITPPPPPLPSQCLLVAGRPLQQLPLLPPLSTLLIPSQQRQFSTSSTCTKRESLWNSIGTWLSTSHKLLSEPPPKLSDNATLIRLLSRNSLTAPLPTRSQPHRMLTAPQVTVYRRIQQRRRKREHVMPFGGSRPIMAATPISTSHRPCPPSEAPQASSSPPSSTSSLTTPSMSRAPSTEHSSTLMKSAPCPTKRAPINSNPTPLGSSTSCTPTRSGVTSSSMRLGTSMTPDFKPTSSDIATLRRSSQTSG